MFNFVTVKIGGLISDKKNHPLATALSDVINDSPEKLHCVLFFDDDSFFTLYCIIYFHIKLVTTLLT